MRASRSCNNGGDASAFAAFSGVAILLGRNWTSERVFFVTPFPEDAARAEDEDTLLARLAMANNETRSMLAGYVWNKLARGMGR